MQKNNVPVKRGRRITDRIRHGNRRLQPSCPKFYVILWASGLPALWLDHSR